MEFLDRSRSSVDVVYMFSELLKILVELRLTFGRKKGIINHEEGLNCAWWGRAMVVDAHQKKIPFLFALMPRAMTNVNPMRPADLRQADFSRCRSENKIPEYDQKDSLGDKELEQTVQKQ